MSDEKYFKKLNKLSACIVLSVIFLIITFVNITPSHADANSAAAGAASSAPSYSALSGQFSNIQSTVTNSGSCVSETGFLTINSSAESTGDLDISVVLNGAAVNISGISGICDNGYIICSPGTFTNCSYYVWGYNGELTSIQTTNPAPAAATVNGAVLNGEGGTTTTQTQAGYSQADCQCINDSCDNGGAPLSETATTLSTLLSQLGGGIEGTLANANSGMVIGTATLNSADTQISYNGYNSATCTNNGGNSGNVGNLTSLNNEGGNSLSSEVGTGALSAAGNSSYFSPSGGATGMLTNIQNETFGNETPETCQIVNQVSFQQSVTYGSGGFIPSSPISNNQVGVGAGGDGACANGSCWGSSSNTIVLATNNPSSTCSPQELPGEIAMTSTSMTGSGACSGTILINSQGIETGGSINCNLGDDGCNTGGNLNFSGTGSSLNISGSDNGTIQLVAVYQYYPLYSRPLDTCSSYASQSGCTLQTKQVCDQNGQNCYTIMSNFNQNANTATNGSSLSCPSGYTLSGSVCEEITSQVYTCPSGYTLSGSTCTEAIPAGTITATYSCPDNGTISGSNCILNASLGCPVSSEVYNTNQCLTTTSPTSTSSGYAGPGFTYSQEQTDQNTGMPPITWTVSMGGSSVSVIPSENTDTINYGTLAVSSAPYGGNDFPQVNETYECQGTNSFDFSQMNTQETQTTATANLNSGTGSFTYTDGITGNAEDGTINGLSQNQAAQSYYCEVSNTSVNSQISSTVPVNGSLPNNTQTSTDKTSTTNTYITCSEQASSVNSSCTPDPNNAGSYLCCQIPSDDTLLQACNANTAANNQNNFTTAAVDMSVMDAAAKSMICTSN